jgi:putative ABC transport system permease protein
MRFLGIAFRNLLRAKRRNGLAGGTMALGAAALVLGGGLSDGIAGQLTRSLVAVQTGHLQVVARPEGFERQNSPFDAYGEDLIGGGVALARRIAALGRDQGIVRAVPYLHGRGTATAGSRSSLASIVGIDPSQEPELPGAHPVEAGAFLSPGDDLGVYVASPVAKKLHLGLGDTVSLVVQTGKGAVNSLDGTVVGIFKKGAPWYDNTFYISLRAAGRLFDGEGAATNIKVFLAPGRGAEAARRAILPVVTPWTDLPPKTAIKVETFEEAGRFSFSIVQANDSALAVLSTFLFLAAAVGTVNSMLMSVNERTREIGTIRALGMRRRGVLRLFVLEGLALGLSSAVLGVALGGAAVLYFGSRGIPMNTVSLAWMAGGDVLYPLLRAANALRAAIAISLLSTVAALYPALVASRLEPREALHHV